MDPLTVGALGIGGLLGMTNWATGLSNSQQNYKLQREMFDWTKEQNDITRMREDTAVQRRAMDLANAGLSPHLAAGSAAETSQPMRADTPQKQHVPLDIDALGMMATATNIGRTQADIAKINADTKYVELQRKLGDQRLKYTESQMQTMELDRQRISATIRQLSDTADHMRHNLQYAREHKLPVGQQPDAWIRRLDGIINAIQRYIGTPLLGGQSLPQYLETLPRIDLGIPPLVPNRPDWWPEENEIPNLPYYPGGTVQSRR